MADCLQKSVSLWYNILRWHMKFSELKNRLKNGVENIYFIFGKDAYLIDASIRLIKSVAITACDDLNFTQYDGRDGVDFNKLLQEAECLPFMSNKRVLYIKNCEFKLNAEQKKSLKKYMENPCSSTVLVFENDEKNAFMTDFGKMATEIDCQGLDAETLKKWIAIELNKSNKTITSLGATRLIEYCNGNLIKINNELLKLKFLLDSTQYDEKDIKENVEKSLDYQIFDLTEAIIKRDTCRALEILNDLYEKKVNSQIIIFTVANFVRRFFYAAVTKETLSAVAQLLGVKEYAIKMAKNKLNNISKSELLQLLEDTLLVDYKIKAGELLEKNAIYNLFFTHTC